jgi:hypothetical protein
MIESIPDNEKNGFESKKQESNKNNQDSTEKLKYIQSEEFKDMKDRYKL